MLPKDPNILLSVINTNLRDHFDSLEDLCLTRGFEINEITKRLNELNYFYDHHTNQFR